MDGIGDFLTTLRNGARAKLAAVEVPHARVRCAILKILKNSGYVGDWEETVDGAGHRRVRVQLRYADGRSPITAVERCSRPGRRMYFGAKALPRVLNGMGIAIVSTSQGLMRDSEARKRNVGGELLCKIY
ncbi:MAG: 30S ribosomal protein S8 [Puniceicoccales bacterium]|jgi:small subunit ribosomal protein S8|nr:30S ribosomal protein S8 [Puniceicoccales bacterium]